MPDAHAGAQIDRLVRNLVLACKGPIRGMAVADQQRLRIEPGQQIAFELRSRQCAPASDGINRPAIPVARHQDAIQMPGNTTLGSVAAPSTWGTIKRARSFLRFEQKRLIGLDDTVERCRPVELDPIEEAVAPTECGVTVYADPVCSLAYGQ